MDLDHGATALQPRQENPAMEMVEPLVRLELRRLDWDTAFFGANMGTIVQVSGAVAPAARQAIELLDVQLRWILTRALTQRYAHLIFRIASEDLPAIWAAEHVGMRLVDLGVDSTFTFGRTALPVSLPGVTVRPAVVADLPALRELAATAFVLSRFAADPFFSAEQVAAFHREWMTNLYEGLAQAVLVCEVAGDLAGFVTCALTGVEGRIPLIATAADHRRQGVGRALVSSALSWFVDAGARVAHVKTQAHNYPALALYHRAGFTVSKTELTFSVAIDSTELG